jgi:hypothetical protein
VLNYYSRARLTLLILSAISVGLFSFREGAKKEQEKQPKSVFIPFPGTTRRKELQKYSPDDPEWQIFKNLRKSPKRIRELCGTFKPAC